jgi:hypothetical protein
METQSINNLESEIPIPNFDTYVRSLPKRLDDWRFESRQGLVIFFFHYRVQTGSGAHPASYPMGTRGTFPGGKAARA